MIELNSNCVKNDIGNVIISEEVIAVISSIAAMEIEGVVGTTSNMNDLSELSCKKNLCKGVKVKFNENKVTIDLNLYIKMDYKVNNIAKDVQKKVKTAVETMTGLLVENINVNIKNIILDKNKERLVNEKNNIEKEKLINEENNIEKEKLINIEN